ncbi:predicted protein [Chaetomium globosum CBS 148.51]|uniref:Uncharacterized protein n=1 Tax=Chaetomium globosum (strain ATCC 6205 / CBS 148.51 / DSM 1962 / NBRC 6347 / NRRL 1970) TaxID=306901 RepID=Q2HHM9_CHAGB|nr:uncharacterized protein CHGG_00275 [Chaetomium globosum CBS 148.51]EAQ92040.1 predicted protein [Chaetomium globosum CBS 148.51]
MDRHVGVDFRDSWIRGTDIAVVVVHNCVAEPIGKAETDDGSLQHSLSSPWIPSNSSTGNRASVFRMPPLPTPPHDYEKPHNVAAVDGQRAHGALAGPSVSQPTGTTPSNFQGITRTTSKRMSSPPPTRSGLATGSVHLPQSRIQVPIIPTSDTGRVHSRSVVQQQTRQCTTPGATVNAPTTEVTPAAKTSPTGFSAGDSTTTTAQTTPVTRASNRNRRKSQRALEADSNTQEAHTN